MPEPDVAEVREIFLKVAEADPEQRSAVLMEACGERGEVRAAVEALLAAHLGAGEFLADPTLDGPTLDGPMRGRPMLGGATLGGATLDGPIPGAPMPGWGTSRGSAVDVPIQERPGTVIGRDDFNGEVRRPRPVGRLPADGLHALTAHEGHVGRPHRVRVGGEHEAGLCREDAPQAMLAHVYKQ